MLLHLSIVWGFCRTCPFLHSILSPGFCFLAVYRGVFIAFIRTEDRLSFHLGTKGPGSSTETTQESSLPFAHCGQKPPRLSN